VIMLLEGVAKMLEWRQWWGGKILHGIIARILICCVGVTDGMADMTSDYSKSLVRSVHVCIFLINSKFAHQWACAPCAHVHHVRMCAQQFQ
jgi:hypothetical protein